MDDAFRRRSVKMTTKQELIAQSLVRDLERKIRLERLADAEIPETLGLLQNLEQAVERYEESLPLSLHHPVHKDSIREISE